MILLILFLLFSFFLIFFIRWFFQPYFLWKKNSQKSKAEKIEIITNEGKTEYYQYMKNNENTKINLSLVIPAYNEEKRLPIMLTESIKYLQNNEEKKYEIIVVNDGSKDKTIETALKFCEFEGKKINLKVINYEFNKGKGGAGMLTALGDQILMVDADGATQFSDLKKLQQNMKQIENNGLGIIAGSRRDIMEKEAQINRTFFRSLLGNAFHFIVSNICGVKLKDTQCGFKLFTKQTAQILFRIQHIERWAFDVELFVIANYQKIPVKEVSVNWQEIDGSKLNVVEASLQMGRDQILISMLYMMKLWKLTDYYIMPSK